MGRSNSNFAAVHQPSSTPIHPPSDSTLPHPPPPTPHIPMSPPLCISWRSLRDSEEMTPLEIFNTRLSVLVYLGNTCLFLDNIWSCTATYWGGGRGGGGPFRNQAKFCLSAGPDQYPSPPAIIRRKIAMRPPHGPPGEPWGGRMAILPPSTPIHSRPHPSTPHPTLPSPICLHPPPSTATQPHSPPSTRIHRYPPTSAATRRFCRGKAAFPCMLGGDIRLRDTSTSDSQKRVQGNSPDSFSLKLVSGFP